MIFSSPPMHAIRKYIHSHAHAALIEYRKGGPAERHSQKRMPSTSTPCQYILPYTYINSVDNQVHWSSLHMLPWNHRRDFFELIIIRHNFGLERCISLVFRKLKKNKCLKQWQLNTLYYIVDVRSTYMWVRVCAFIS